MGLAMMRKKPATIEDLNDVPEGMNGELVDGEIFASARPAVRHAIAGSALSSQLGMSFGRAKGSGPGGWWLLVESELLLGPNVLVPDIGGWRRERMVTPPDVARIELPPDWVCEIASPSTERFDRLKKMPVYARAGVRHMWIVRPEARLVEAYALENESWRLLGAFGDPTGKIPPFDAVEIDLDELWVRDPQGEQR